MRRVKFLAKTITVCSGEEEGFDCKNNYKCGKSTNFRLDNISKINYKMLVVLSYILSELGTRKIRLIRRLFK